MSSPDVKKASRDPEAIYEACAVAARQSRGKDIEEKTSSCANEVMGSPYFPDLASARRNVSCMDGYKGAKAHGKCLADAMWPAPKAKAYAVPKAEAYAVPKAKAYAISGFLMIDKNNADQLSSGISSIPAFTNSNIDAFKHFSIYELRPCGCGRGKSSEEEKPNVVFRVKFPFGSEESYGYAWFKKDGRELTLEDAQKINRGISVSSEIYFNCQQGTPYDVGRFISRGGSCEKPLVVTPALSYLKSADQLPHFYVTPPSLMDSFRIYNF